MPAVQVDAPVGRRRGCRHIRGRDDCVRARSRRFLGGVVRALSDDLPRARGPGQASRGGPQGRKGRRRRESRTRDQVWRAVDPIASRDPGRARDRPSCRRASSRCAGAAVAASAPYLSVDRGSTFRDGRLSRRRVAQAAGQRGPRRHCEGATGRRRLAGDERRLVSESDSYAGAIGRPGRDDRIVDGTRALQGFCASKRSPAALNQRYWRWRRRTRLARCVRPSRRRRRVACEAASHSSWAARSVASGVAGADRTVEPLRRDVTPDAEDPVARARRALVRG